MPNSSNDDMEGDSSMKNNAGIHNNKEHELIGSLGISLKDAPNNNDDDDNNNNNNEDSAPELGDEQDEDASGVQGEVTGYEVVPNPSAEAVDLSGIRGGNDNANNKTTVGDLKQDASDEELDALEELVPDVKNRRRSNEKSENSASNNNNNNNNNMTVSGDGDAVEVQVGSGAAAAAATATAAEKEAFAKRHSMQSTSSTMVRNITTNNNAGGGPDITRVDSMRVQRSKDFDDSNKPSAGAEEGVPSPVPETGANAGSLDEYNAEDEASSSQDDDDDVANSDMYEGLDGNESDNAIGAEAADPKSPALEQGEKIPKEFLNMSSGQSLSTATQTHEVRMPMYLPTFKPATGCTNASDFIVRCFVARLRSGITVVKHGRSRWCKSRLRILHIHPDGCSLSWKPAEGEPTSNRRPPKLDLTQCLEVRHAWSPDPQNPMYTGTPILRQKCEAANAHKSFALIFPKRTVDITAVTADQCKVLMEGFSALCFRLQVADLAGKGAKKGNGGGGRGMPEEDGVSTTASVTLTNSSTPRAR